jgi:hypothetical protein
MVGQPLSKPKTKIEKELTNRLFRRLSVESFKPLSSAVDLSNNKLIWTQESRYQRFIDTLSVPLNKLFHLLLEYQYGMLCELKKLLAQLLHSVPEGFPNILHTKPRNISADTLSFDP